MDNLEQLPNSLCKIVTPMKASEWRNMLATYPDKRFANFLLRGIESGFRIGFNRNMVQLKSRHQNLISAVDHPQVVQAYLDNEIREEWVISLGSPQEALQLGIQCSPFGVIPKKHKPDAWRLTVDLSSPEGHSVNDGISKELCSQSYVSLDDVVAWVCISKNGY